MILLGFYLNVSATYYSYSRYYKLKGEESPDQEYSVSPLFAGEFEYYLQIKKTWLAMGKWGNRFIAWFMIQKTNFHKKT